MVARFDQIFIYICTAYDLPALAFHVCGCACEYVFETGNKDEYNFYVYLSKAIRFM